MGRWCRRIPNNCVFITEPTPESFPAGEGLLSSLEAVIEGLEENPVTVLFGEMVPDILQTTKDQHRWRLGTSSTSTSYPSSLELHSSKIEKNYNNSTPVDLHIALPPVEVNKARRVLESSLGGEYRVEFPKLKRASESEVRQHLLLRRIQNGWRSFHEPVT